ncbi:tyrosinase family protein [Daejeonella oryzae]|uniref:tyrosinase family protein n=1 Tax=Daejeonella oryzae TaxID=1122943 RepID=UPI00068722A4|nr:tyrosinase family protein [Daejeonella oryzae]
MKLLLFITSMILFHSATNIVAQEIPVISVQINSTETSKDDYIGSKYIKCTIGLINGTSFTSNIPVTLRNMSLTNGGRVTFSSTGGKSRGSISLDLTLTRDNLSKTFYIKCRDNINSKIDKDAAVEVLDDRSGFNHSVLARKAFMVIPSTPLPSTSPRIEIKINSASTLDDYVTWSPTFCSIRLANYSSFSSSISVQLRNMSNSTGKVNFTNSDLAINSTASNTTLNLSLPNSGTWVNFFIAGRFNNPSVTDKDAVIEILNPSNGAIYSREALMVRVRKNANNLSVLERERFLNAIVTLNNSNNEFMTFVEMHTRPGIPEGHNGPGFLPWHRAFVLNLERKLQAVDPGVALPYWKFDVAAPSVFSGDFMGSKPLTSTDAFADFYSSNPMSVWNMAGGIGIRRTTSFADNADPSTGSTTIRSEISTLSLGSTYTLFKSMESNPHGTAHNLAASVSGDWLRSLQTAVQDPLFFLVHANVDRLWAKWQWANSLFNPLDVNTYSPQGEYPDSGTIHIGHYLNDTMWPWNGITGSYTGSGTIYPGVRPTTAPGGSFPSTLSLPTAPTSFPQPYQMIDYKNNRLSSITNSGLGFCYDDIPFQ